MATACTGDSGTNTTVAHGRRKGTVRTSKGSSGGIHPSQVAVVDEKEWSRMQEKLASWRNPPITKAAQIQKYRKDLHHHSQEVVKNWSNTIEGHRQKRLQAKKIKEEKEEEERQKIDHEEAEFQAEQRKKAIERAKTLMYYQTDRVKALHSSYMLSEVLREREAQIEHVERKTELLKMQDERYLQLQREEQEKAQLKDQMIAKKKSEEMAVVFRVQHQQAIEAREKRRLQREAQLKEQRKINEAVETFKKSEKEKALKMAEVRVEHRKTLDWDLEDRVKRKAEYRKLEEREDHRRKIFNDAKRGMEKLKKQKEMEWQEQLEEQQESIRDHLHAQMMKASQDEDARIGKMVEEQHAKREAEEQEKAGKQAEMSREMYKHMIEQMSELELKRKEQQKNEEELMKMKFAEAIKFKREEREKEQKKRLEALDLQDFYVSQTKEMAARKQVEADDEFEYVNKNKHLLQVEEAQYQHYANTLMTEVKDRKAPLGPFHNTTKEGAGGGHGPVLTGLEVRPSYQATDDCGIELPSYSHYESQPKANTQQRMGFNW